MCHTPTNPVSHAHGLSTGSTAALINYAAGAQLTESAGSTWKVAPQLFNLTTVQASLTTREELDRFSIEMPSSTTATVVLPSISHVLKSKAGWLVKVIIGAAIGLQGEIWKLQK